MKKKIISCKKVYTHICDNLDKDLNSPECREIKRHLDSCPNCVTYLDSLKKTIILFRDYPDPKVPKNVHGRIFAKVHFK